MCDHMGEYKTYTRMVGYTPVHVYLCHSCGADMAMDTLPQHLLTRMWGNLDRCHFPSIPIPPVDLCIVFCGNLALQCARIMFYSLSKTIAALRGVTFHLVNQDVPEEEFRLITDMVPGCKTYQRPPIPTPRPYGLVDAEWSYDWMVKNCGTNKWVAISHFDLFFSADFLTFLRFKANLDVGMMGHCCPFSMINRDAYAQSVFGFRTAGPFSAVTLPEQPDQFWLYSINDERVVSHDSRSKVLRTSFDTGELLELELRTYGWKCEPMREIFNNYFYHFSGAGHIVGEQQLVDITRRMRMFTEVYNIPDNPVVKI